MKAADDAAALAVALDETADFGAALRTFEARRRPVGAAFVARARTLGCYLRRSFASDAERRDAEHHAAPVRVLAETARVDFAQP